ncbi:MAG: hypothetical protein H6599_00850 [Flavobacteriales bacterium]|nr:hypothetical protein [Flavobacteriales bacterium]
MKKNILLGVAVLGLMSSCSMIKTTKTTPRTVETYNSNIIIKPLVAEVEVDVNKKITATVTVTSGTEESAKELAKWQAIQDSGADIIVDPVYHTTILGAKITTTVTGYYGKYVKIETVSSEDVENLNMYMQSENGDGGKGSVVTKLKKLKK